MMNTKHILLADDDEDFALLVQLSLQEAAVLNSMTIVGDGHEVLSYFNGEGCYADRSAYPLPALIMLDVKLGRLSGFEVLNWIRQQPKLDSIRVVLLSSLGTEEDAVRAQGLGADLYMAKPFRFQELIEAVRELNSGILLTQNAVQTRESNAAYAHPSVPRPAVTYLL